MNSQYFTSREMNTNIKQEMDDFDDEICVHCHIAFCKDDYEEHMVRVHGAKRTRLDTDVTMEASNNSTFSGANRIKSKTVTCDLCLFEVNETQIGSHYRTMHKLTDNKAIEVIKLPSKKQEWRRKNGFTDKRGECRHCHKIFSTLKSFNAHNCAAQPVPNTVTKYFHRKCPETRETGVQNDSQMKCSCDLKQQNQSLKAEIEELKAKLTQRDEQLNKEKKLKAKILELLCANMTTEEML